MAGASRRSPTRSPRHDAADPCATAHARSGARTTDVTPKPVLDDDEVAVAPCPPADRDDAAVAGRGHAACPGSAVKSDAARGTRRRAAPKRVADRRRRPGAAEAQRGRSGGARRRAASVAGAGEAVGAEPRPGLEAAQRRVRRATPKPPSTGPDGKPWRPSWNCSAATSQPRRPAAITRRPSHGRPRRPSARRRQPARRCRRPRAAVRAWKRARRAAPCRAPHAVDRAGVEAAGPQGDLERRRCWGCRPPRREHAHTAAAATAVRDAPEQLMRRAPSRRARKSLPCSPRADACGRTSPSPPASARRRSVLRRRALAASAARAACCASARAGRCAARRPRRAARPRAVGAELPGVRVVGEAALERVEQVVAQRRVLDRGEQLDARVEVARHEVGGADVDASARRRARTRRCASARGSGRRPRRRGCSPTRPARPGAGSRCRGC